MKLTKYLGALVIAVLVTFLIVAKFSTKETRFQCSGEILSERGSRPTVLFVRLDEYRWWVKLWSDSDGALWLEKPTTTAEYYERVVEVGDQLQIFDFQKQIKGNYSDLSKTLAISTSVGSFSGSCKKSD